VILNRLVQFIRNLFSRPQRSTSSPPAKIDSPRVDLLFDGEPLRIEFDGIVLTFGTINIDNFPSDDSDDPIFGCDVDENTILFRSSHDDAANQMYYRDEDGELRPVRHDCTPLADMPLEEIAAEFLSAKSDADTMPDPLEREIIAALRDSYGRELWRRATTYAISKVEVCGRRYEIVPLPISGCVQMLIIE
jgi:hypothetical protein